MDIKELIVLGREGNEKALYYLYNAYFQRMIAKCAKIVGDRMIAEELALLEQRRM